MLVSINFLLDVSSAGMDGSEPNKLDEFVAKLVNLAEGIESDIKLDWESTQVIDLDPNTMNCGKCENCGCWVSNREFNDFMPQLNVAAMDKGRLLCDECLPNEHRLSF